MLFEVASRPPRPPAPATSPGCQGRHRTNEEHSAAENRTRFGQLFVLVSAEANVDLKPDRPNSRDHERLPGLRGRSAGRLGDDSV